MAEVDDIIALDQMYMNNFRLDSEVGLQRLLSAIVLAGFAGDVTEAGLKLAKARYEWKQVKDARDFVISFVHHSGEHYYRLSSTELWDIYCSADGFGRRTPGELADIGWDWSHIRESSIEGIKRMEAVLRTILKTKIVVGAVVKHKYTDEKYVVKGVDGIAVWVYDTKHGTHETANIKNLEVII